jgi:limonene-1,2-epoxide hydrolase
MSAEPDARPRILRRAPRLEYLTVGWNIIEGVDAVAAALAAKSIVLLGFGVDSVVETASGGIVIWRLPAERRAKDTEAWRVEIGGKAV